MLVLGSSSRMLVSAAILCTFLPQALPKPFLPSLSQLQQLPLQFQQSLRSLLGQPGPFISYKGRPTTLRPKRPTPSSSQQHQEDLNQLLEYQPEEIGGGERRPESAQRPKNPWEGFPSLSGHLVSVTTSSNDLLDNTIDTVDHSDEDGLFREDVLLGRPLHDKKINRNIF